MNEGKICTKCNERKPLSEYHKAKRNKDGHFNQCKVCINKQNKKWKQVNDEHYKQQQKEYKKENADHFKQYKKQWEEDNAEHRKEQKAQYYEANKEYIKEQQREYYNANKEARLIVKRRYNHNNKVWIYANNKQWAIDNKERINELYYRKHLKRKSYKHKVIFKPFERMEILDRDNWTCQECGTWVHDARVGDWNNEHKAHIDHIIPISKGGDSTPENLQTLCRTCNLAKSNRID